MKLPDWSHYWIYAAWIISAGALLVAARYRVSLLLAAGAAPPGVRRMAFTTRLLGLDLLNLVALAMLLRLYRHPFPLLIASVLVLGISVGLLYVQWFFHRAEKPPTKPGAPPVSGLLREGLQSAQDAALAAGYNRAETWVKQELRKNRMKLGLIYEGALFALCLGLRVLETVQGYWLYMIFSLLWQAGCTGWLYFRFDRRKPAAASTPSPGAPGVPGSPTGGGWPPAGARRPSAPRSPGSPGAAPAGSTESGSVSRKRLALRQDVQAFVALSAGFWCGIFDRWFGWLYGFVSVIAFRALLNLLSPLSSQLLRRYLPPALQVYLKPEPRRPAWSLAYLKSGEFWYGPGMGMVGGVAGAALWYLFFPR